MLREVLTATGLTYPESPVRVVAEIIARRVYLSARGFGEPESSTPSPGDVVRLDACWSACLGLNMIDILRSTLFQARHACLVLRAGDTRHRLRALGTEICYTACEGGHSKRARSERIRE